MHYILNFLYCTWTTLLSSLKCFTINKNKLNITTKNYYFKLNATGVVWNFEVKTFGGNNCDFSVWDDNGITPNYEGTCTRKYLSSGFLWKALYPWCYQKRGSWDYCNG